MKEKKKKVREMKKIQQLYYLNFDQSNREVAVPSVSTFF